MKKVIYLLSFVLLITSAAHAVQAQTPYCVNGKTASGATCVVVDTPSQTGTGNSTTPAPASQTTSTITPCGTNCNLGYTPLEPIPGITANSNGVYDLTTSAGFSNLINAIFKIMISAGALLAVVSLTIGGVQYMVSGSAVLKGKAIGRVKASMWGILLIAGIWLILNTINPNLLNFNFNPCPIKSATCASIPYNPTVPAPPAPNVSAMTPDQIQAAQNSGSIGNLVATPNTSNTFTFTNGSAGNTDLNSQFATWSSACTAAHGSIQSGPQINNGGTLTMVCAQQ